MKIAKRLQEIGILIPKTNTVIDVGCDHGLLGIYLLSTKKCKHMINTDISEKALQSAKKNTEKYHFEKKTSFYVTDGLKNVPYHKEDVIVITGMGAYTIINIIKKEKQAPNTLILSAHTNIPYLRREIVKMGYKMIDEKAIFDKKWYIIMHLEKGVAKYEEIDYILGPFAKKNKKYVKEIIKKEKQISKKRKKKTEILLLLENQKNL